MNFRDSVCFLNEVRRCYLLHILYTTLPRSGKNFFRFLLGTKTGVAAALCRRFLCYLMDHNGGYLETVSDFIGASRNHLGVVSPINTPLLSRGYINSNRGVSRVCKIIKI